MPLHKGGVTHHWWGLDSLSLNAPVVFWPDTLLLSCVKLFVLLSSKNSAMLKVMLGLKGSHIDSRTAGKLLPQLDMSDGWMLPLLRIGSG